MHDGEGRDAVMVIAAPSDGTVRASLGGTAITLTAAEVSKLIELYRLAQVVALQDRGRW